MNKTWTASILAALLPFSIWAADGSGDVSKTGQGTMAEVARIDRQDGAEEIVPIDLDAASEAYDIVLPQQPVHMTADSLVMRSADGYIQGRGNVDLRQGMDELHTSYIEGSTNNQLYHTPGPAVYLTSENALSGTGIIYNSKDGDASMDTIEGFIAGHVHPRHGGGNGRRRWLRQAWLDYDASRRGKDAGLLYYRRRYPHLSRRKIYG